MAETKTEPKSDKPELKVEPKADIKKAEAPKDASKDKPSTRGNFMDPDPPHMVMRALMGFAGLSLLVGFFLEWIRIPARPAAEEGGEPIAAHMVSGLQLLGEASVGGPPPATLLIIPIVGALLSAAAFMGFRWAAHVAIAVAGVLVLYGLWVVIRLFVENTGAGLWVTVGGTLVILLLGVISLLWNRDRGPKPAAKPATPAKP